MGGDVSLTHAGEWNLFGIYMLANDSKNVFASQGVINPQAARWTGGFVELDYYPNELPFFKTPGWFFAYRFGLIRNIQQGDPTFADDYNNVNSHAFVMRYNFHISSRTDIAWVTEFNYSSANDVGANGENQMGQIVFSGFPFKIN